MTRSDRCENFFGLPALLLEAVVAFSYYFIPFAVQSIAEASFCYQSHRMTF